MPGLLVQTKFTSFRSSQNWAKIKRTNLFFFFCESSELIRGKLVSFIGSVYARDVVRSTLNVNSYFPHFLRTRKLTLAREGVMSVTSSWFMCIPRLTFGQKSFIKRLSRWGARNTKGKLITTKFYSLKFKKKSLLNHITANKLSAEPRISLSN